MKRGIPQVPLPNLATDEGLKVGKGVLGSPEDTGSTQKKLALHRDYRILQRCWV